MHSKPKVDTVNKYVSRYIAVIVAANNWMMGATTIQLVLANLILSYIIVVPVALILLLFIGSFPYAAQTFTGGYAATFFIVCVVAPPIETFIFQWLPIRLMNRTKKFRTWQVVVTSSVIFGAAHWYSIYYVFFAACTGLVLAYVFIICDETGKNSFLTVSLIHFLRNLVTFVCVIIYTNT